MPIIFNELDAPFPGEPPEEGALASRVAELERRVAVLEETVRDLTGYCRQLEVTCREAFADRPGRVPFPPIARS